MTIRDEQPDILIRQVDRHLARLRLRPQARDLGSAERIADCLRRLITETVRASAADRARVRAAVRYFVTGARRPVAGPAGRFLLAEQRVVNDVARHLGLLDLVVPDDAARPDVDVGTAARSPATSRAASGLPPAWPDILTK
ncbi:MAG TPA: hypothetical protein VF174_11650 [Micromonosporaceae bacterium]